MGSIKIRVDPFLAEPDLQAAIFFCLKVSSINMKKSIILSRTAYGSNLGAAARAMKTMGLTDLRLAMPEADIQGPKARALAKHAIEILENAQTYSCLEGAVADCDLVVAASHRHRRIEKPVIESRDLLSWLGKHCSSHTEDKASNLRVALLFGPESTGLSLAELALCDAIVTVPTKHSQPSLNLAQAVMIIAYELGRDLKISKRPEKNPKLQCVENSEASFNVLKAKLESKLRDLNLKPQRYLNALEQLEPKSFYLLHDLLNKL